MLEYVNFSEETRLKSFQICQIKSSKSPNQNFIVLWNSHNLRTCFMSSLVTASYIRMLFVCDDRMTKQKRFAKSTLVQSLSIHYHFSWSMRSVGLTCETECRNSISVFLRTRNVIHFIFIQFLFTIHFLSLPHRLSEKSGASDFVSYRNYFFSSNIYSS